MDGSSRYEAKISQVPSAKMEETFFMTPYCSNHQGMMESLWLHFWRAVLLSIFMNSLRPTQHTSVDDIAASCPPNQSAVPLLPQVTVTLSDMSPLFPIEMLVGFGSVLPPSSFRVAPVLGPR
ncbi:unnamed protein product [Pleuronectes platessa]|uniref:Uncharacterized protein n=1 Tax=Pleuronectes platessa TaxID=8262 RepID=A0A9N7VQ33_PLEPL|nr:unnamed protein product [Pleuronectes platessa]